LLHSFIFISVKVALKIGEKDRYKKVKELSTRNKLTAGIIVKSLKFKTKALFFGVLPGTIIGFKLFRKKNDQFFITIFKVVKNEFRQQVSSLGIFIKYLY